jgi:hypothetical protein
VTLDRREFLAIGAGLASLPLLPQEDGLVVHEWGVVTMACGSARIAGVRSEGATFVGGVEQAEQLPAFVATWKGSVDKAIEDWRNMPVRKPVVHFHAKRRMTVDVAVQVPKGRPHAWWPKTDEYAPKAKLPRRGKGFDLDDEPSADAIKPENGALVWKELVLDPAAAPSLDARGWWALARKTASTPVMCGTECERFLFYDALTPVDPGLDVEWTKAGSVKLSARADIAHAFAVRVKDGACRFAHRKGLAKGASCELEPAAGRPDLVPVLVEAGLCRDEAEAVAAIWKEEFFEAAGARVISLVPRETYDAVLPIRITPEPAKLARVLLAHIESVDPDRLGEVEAALDALGSESLDERDAAAKKLKGLGPLAEGLIRRAAETAKDAEVKGRLLELLK